MTPRNGSLNCIIELSITGTGKEGLKSAERGELVEPHTTRWIADPSHQIDVGYSEDRTKRELAEAIADAVGCASVIEWDCSNPQG